jgi:hypothetical protein
MLQKFGDYIANGQTLSDVPTEGRSPGAFRSTWLMPGAKGRRVQERLKDSTGHAKSS